MIALLIPFVQTFQVLCAELLLKKRRKFRTHIHFESLQCFYTILRSWKDSEKVKENKRNTLGYSPARAIYEIPQEGILKDLGQENYPKLSKQIGIIIGFFFSVTR